MWISANELSGTYYSQSLKIQRLKSTVSVQGEAGCLSWEWLIININYVMTFAINQAHW